MAKLYSRKIPDLTGVYTRSSKQRIAIAVATTGAALLITAVGMKALDWPLLLLFATAVVITALVAGFRAGCLATGLSLASIAYVILPRAGGDDARVLLLFAATGVVLSWIVGRTAEMRRQIANELKEKTRLVARVSELASIVESSHDAIYSKDLDGTITNWNRAAEDMYGYTAEDAVGQNVSMLIPQEYADEERRTLEMIASGQRTPHHNTERVRKDGRRIRVAVVVSPVFDEHGKVIGASSIARDITLEEQRQAMLIASEKAAAMGRIAGSMAHEINNPLAAISDLVVLLSRKPPQDLETRRYLEMLSDEVARLVRITRQTLGFYQESRAPVAVDLGKAVNDVLALYAKEIAAEEIQVQTRIESGRRIEGFPADVRHVLSNLVMNAIEAAGRRGRIRIEIEDAPGAPERLTIRVSDNGPGIPPAIAERVFEPFFSTKGEKGTGLGLWVSRGIVARHGGELRFHTETEGAGHGTTFEVVLPKRFPERQRRIRRGAA